MSVPQGGTLYIKYNSAAPEALLQLADHGRGPTGGWRGIGPALTDGIGAHPEEPVVLRVTRVGTPESTVAWVNGPAQSGTWDGIPVAGPYDLALHSGARWNGPAIVVTEVPRKPGFWASWFRRDAPTQPGPTPAIVPDGGATALLLVIALLSLASLRRLLR